MASSRDIHRNRDTHRSKDTASNKPTRLNSRRTDRGLIVTLPRKLLRLIRRNISSRTPLVM